MAFVSPLRYPGGKGRLGHFISRLIENNGLTDGRYVEPYAGGAGIALILLYSEVVRRAHINDVSKNVYSFWWSVLNATDELCKLINDTPLSIDQWHIQRAVQDDEDASQLELGFSTFYLNRVNRSGIIRGGIIGGKNQSGKWKLDARYNKVDLLGRIERIARYRDRISLHNLDAAELLTGVVPSLPEKTLIYLDPPYWVKGGDLYEHHYGPQQHEKIADIVSTLARPWVVSYDNVPEVCDLYSSFRQQTFGIPYSANGRFQGSEVMIFADGLNIPGPVVPSRAKVA